MNNICKKSSIIVALDFSESEPAMKLAKQLDPSTCRLKIGKELFTACGPGIVESLQNSGFEIFLDLKFHDIPNTVARACRVAADLGIWMLNVHASGGLEMLTRAQEAIDKSTHTPLLIAVTVLTSMSNEQWLQLGMQRDISKQVHHLASLTQQAGISGVVCSAQEAKMLKENYGDNFLLVTPGIRLNLNNTQDQSRVQTPSEAQANGVDYLVIGRPITQAKEPHKMVDQILKSLN